MRDVRPDRTTWHLAGLFLLVALVVACAAVQHRTARIAAALEFSHAGHSAQGIDCGDCHEGATENRGLTRGELIPTKETCEGCHEDQVKNKCGFCHTSSDRKIKLTRVNRRLKFSHATHAGRDKRGCKGCHPGAAAAKVPGIKLVPDMAGCADRCHKKDMAQQRCKKCHQDLQRQRLLPVAQLGHQGNWIRRHGELARDVSRCSTCHDQTHCGECHGRTAARPLSLRFPERVVSRFIHRGDWLGRHGTMARAESSTCRKCHGSNHCRSCHQQSGRARTLSAGSSRTKSPHGTGWMIPGSSDFHGRRARRDVSHCASCHDRGAASNCVGCHKVGGTGGNPHPRSFRWADKSNQCRDNSMCATCHTGGLKCP